MLPENVIIDTVLEYYGVDRDRFFANLKRQKKDLVMQRQLCMIFIKKYTTLSLSKTGGMFGKDHTTVLHAKRKIYGYMDSYQSFRNEFNELDELIGIRLKSVPDEREEEKVNYREPIVISKNGVRMEKRLDDNRWHYILVRNNKPVTLVDMALCKQELNIKEEVSVVIPDVVPESGKISELHLLEVI